MLQLPTKRKESDTFAATEVALRIREILDKIIDHILPPTCAHGVYSTSDEKWFEQSIMSYFRQARSACHLSLVNFAFCQAVRPRVWKWLNFRDELHFDRFAKNVTKSAGTEHLCPVGDLIRHVDVNFTVLNPSCFKVFAIFPNLESVYIGDCQFASIGEHWEWKYRVKRISSWEMSRGWFCTLLLDNLPALEELTLDIQGVHVPIVAELIVASCPNLRALALHSCNLEASQLEVIGRLSKLVYLKLFRFRFVSEGFMKALGSLVRKRELNSLLLEGCDIADADVRALGKMSSLSRICLKGSQITDASIPVIMKACPYLRVLDLRMSSNLSEKTIDAVTTEMKKSASLQKRLRVINLGHSRRFIGRQAQVDEKLQKASLNVTICTIATGSHISNI